MVYLKNSSKDFFETQDLSSPSIHLQKLCSTYGLQIFSLHSMSEDSCVTESFPTCYMPLIRFNHQIKQRKWDSTETKYHLINRGKNSTEILFRAGFSSHFLWWKPYYSIFSQVAPSCPKFHLSYAKDTLFTQLFPIYHMNEPSWAMFKNMVFGSYFLNPWPNQKFFCV